MISFQNLAGDVVCVSRLCCPVCWELYKILGKEGTVRGCHSTVTPVVLPETLPDYISTNMVTRFRAHLSSQLRHLLSPPAVGLVTGLKNMHHRHSSESGYSASSSNEGATKMLDATKQFMSVYASADPTRNSVVPGATL